MCGRTACTLAPNDVVCACTYKDAKGQSKKPAWKDPPGGQKYWTSYNIAPTAHTPVLVSSQRFDDPEIMSTTERVVTPMKWGMTPSWHKGDPYKIEYETNNCRMEGMLEKKTYKVPLQKGNRCVVLADGYFEWKTSKDGKQPYFFYFPQPNDVQFPPTIVKTEAKTEGTDAKEEKKVKLETHLDRALKKEMKMEAKDIKVEPKAEIKEENADIKHEVKTEIKQEPADAPDNNNAYSNNAEKCTKDGSGMQCSKPSSEKANGCSSSGDDDDVKEWNGHRLLTMAGVYDVWKPPDGSPPLYSYSIITVPASSTVDWCHHRMPAILSTEEEVADWLDSANIPLEKAKSLIKSKSGLAFHPVSKVVNNSRNKSPDCVKVIELDKPKRNPSSNLMMNWLSGSPAKKKKV